MAIKTYIFVERLGAPRTPSEPPSWDPESSPKGRERGLPAIPKNSRIDAKSKNDQYKYKNNPRRPARLFSEILSVRHGHGPIWRSISHRLATTFRGCSRSASIADHVHNGPLRFRSLTYFVPEVTILLVLIPFQGRRSCS